MSNTRARRVLIRVGRPPAGKSPLACVYWSKNLSSALSHIAFFWTESIPSHARARAMRSSIPTIRRARWKLGALP